MDKDHKQTVIIYNSTEFPNSYFIREDVLKKFHIHTIYREFSLDGYYYAIPNKVAISIYNNSKMENSTYQVKFIEAPLGKAVQRISSETAKDLCDSFENDNYTKDKEIKTK